MYRILPKLCRTCVEHKLTLKQAIQYKYTCIYKYMHTSRTGILRIYLLRFNEAFQIFQKKKKVFGENSIWNSRIVLFLMNRLYFAPAKVGALGFSSIFVLIYIQAAGEYDFVFLLITLHLFQPLGAHVRPARRLRVYNIPFYLERTTRAIQACVFIVRHAKIMNLMRLVVCTDSPPHYR